MEIQNLSTFPIERLGFLLKLEVLDQLDAKDVIELVRVNRGFHWMISNRPWVVFGRHVDLIWSGEDSEFNIRKLLKSNNMFLDVSLHFPFIKNIRSCNQLRRDYYSSRDERCKNYADFLKQLKAVNRLLMRTCKPQQLEFLFNMPMKITEYVHLPSFIQKVPSMKDLAEHFIETQLNECEEVAFECYNDDAFYFYYNASKKTHIEHVAFHYRIDKLNGAEAVQWIVSHGIPSDNPAADCLLRKHGGFTGDIRTTIVVFLVGYPGMQQITKETRQLWPKDYVKRYQESTFWEGTLFFRRGVDATRDCIYLLSSTDFFAYYIKPDEMNVY